MSSSGQPRHRTEEMTHLLGWFHTHLGARAANGRAREPKE
jgi:hypothetical protein